MYIQFVCNFQSLKVHLHYTQGSQIITFPLDYFDNIPSDYNRGFAKVEKLEQLFFKRTSIFTSFANPVRDAWSLNWSSSYKMLT